jgi:putative nucleotidyltransferase with HDIG domain
MLRGLLENPRYHHLTLPETAAIPTSLPTRRDRIETSLLGTNGNDERITQKGEFQVDFQKISEFFLGTSRPRGQDWLLVAYTSALLAASILLTVSFVTAGMPWSVHWAVLALAGASLIAERQSVRLSARAEISVSFLPIVLAAVAYGPLAAIVVSTTSLLLNLRAPLVRWVVWTSARCLAAGAAGLVAWHMDAQSKTSLTGVLTVVVATTAIEQVGELLLGSVTARLRGIPFREIASEGSTIFLALPLYTPVVAVLIYAYRDVSAWSVGLFLVPAFAAQRLFLLYREQRDTADALALAVERQERANLSFASALVATLDARDRYTAGHSAAVAVYARDIAARLGLPESDQRRAHLCGLVHDIGKVGLPAGLLEKPGPLTLDERRQMEQHAEIGERILANVDDYAEIAAIVRHHHERVDGNGYPDGLNDAEIPLLSRIIAVADAYDAMISDRPYRDAMPSRVARLRLAQAVGAQFDTSVVAAFEAILAAASEAYHHGDGADFAFNKRIASVELTEPALLTAAAR